MNEKNQDGKSSIITITLISLCLFVMALSFFMEQNRQRIELQNREYLRDNAIQIAERLDDTIKDGQDNIVLLANLVSSSLKSTTFDVQSIQLLVKNTVFDFVEYVDADGYNHTIAGTVTDASDRSYYIESKKGYSGVELIHYSRATKETLLLFYAPIDYRGQYAGAIIGVFQATGYIYDLIHMDYFGVEADSYFIKDDGRIEASNMNYDPRESVYIWDEIAESETQANEIKLRMSREEDVISLAFAKNATGGIMVRLEEYGGYLVQMFPTEVSEKMIRDANWTGLELAAFLIIVAIFVLVSVVIFYTKQKQIVLQEAKRAERANKAKSDFLFNMSHDIRTPMNAILGFTEIGLKQVDDPESVKKNYKKIKSAGDHLLGLINDLLEMSRIESGHLELVETPVDLLDVKESIEQMSLTLAEQKNITFVTDSTGITNPYIYADKIHMNEVWINLISNAIKYTPEGGRVRFAIRQLDKKQDDKCFYRFIVTDNGIGMSDEFKNHLFEAFSREANATTSKVEGAGLGLSIVKKIVDIGGGTIRVKSVQGVGTTFIVDFPFRIMTEEEIQNSHFTEKKQNSTKDKENIFKGKKVLLVEDNEMNREIATEILSDVKLDVETACNGQEAVDMVKEKGVHYYDFILMDIQMPVMNGYDATKQIRLLPEGDLIPIIALSANAFEEDKANSKKAGMNDHVAKPIRVNELFETVARYL